jgi:hypothetical protein
LHLKLLALDLQKWTWTLRIYRCVYSLHVSISLALWVSGRPDAAWIAHMCFSQLLVCQ